MDILAIQKNIGKIEHSLRPIEDSYKNYFSRFIGDPITGSSAWVLTMLNYFFKPASIVLESSLEIHQLVPLNSIKNNLEILEKINEITILLNQEFSSDIANKIHYLLQEIDTWYKVDYSSLKEELQVLSTQCDKITRSKITKDLIKRKLSYLYHGVKLEYVKEILERQSILGYTTQRHWDKGKRFKETDPEYQDSFWMKGISMSRDFDYALGWGSVLLIFDKDLIQKKHEIQPYSWNYHMDTKDNPSRLKHEKEDFVVLSKKKKQYKNKDNPEWMKEYEEMMGEDIDNLKKELEPEEIEHILKMRKEWENKKEKINLENLKEAEGEFDFSKNNALVGIILREHIIRIYGIEDETVKYIMNHPLFLGILDSKR